MIKSIISAFLLASIQLPAEESNQWIRIIDKDRATGIAATIRKITADDKNILVSKSGRDGYLLKKFECELLEKIKVVPNDTNYYQEECYCPLKSNTIALRSAKYEFNLLSHAKLSFAKGDFGTAAFAYNEIAARVSRSDSRYTDLASNTYNSAAKYFHIDKPTSFDPQQHALVMSSELQQAILELQKVAGLNETGQLDFKTLEYMSNKNLKEVLFDEVK